MSDRINRNGAQEPRIPYAADPLAYYRTDPKPTSTKKKGATGKPMGGDDYHCTPLLQEDSASPRLVQKRLRSLLGRKFKALTDLTIKLWNTPSIEDHHAVIIELANAGETIKLAAYLTNITDFAQHRARVALVRSKIRSPNPQVRASVQRTIDRFKDSNDSERRAFGARLEKAVNALDTLSEHENQPRPLNLTGRGYGFDVWDVPFRIAAESREIVALFQDERFQEVWQEEYKATDEYKAAKRVQDTFTGVKLGDQIVKDLQSKDPKVRTKGYDALVTKIKAAGNNESGVDGTVPQSQATVILTHDRTLSASDRDSLKALHETPPTEPMISVRTIDSDASDEDRRIQAEEAQEEAARMQRDQAVYDAWHVRHERGLKIVGGLYTKFVTRLEAAKPESAMVKRIAKSERVSERKALVSGIRKLAHRMRGFNKKDADLVVKLAGEIEAEQDLGKLAAKHQDASFIAQTGMMQAQIRGLRKQQKLIEGQMKRDGKTAYWAARISMLGIWRPDMPITDSNLRIVLDSAERSLRKARKMYENGEIKSRPEAFAHHMTRVRKQFRKISKAINEDKKFVNSAESSFMRTSVGFGIIAAAVLASAVTGGVAGALFGKGALAAVATLLVSSATLTGVQTAGNHYIMGQDVTWGSFTEDLVWNTAMFGAFGPLGKWLKARAGINVAQQGAKTSAELLARIPARYGMEGMKLTAVNILKLSGKGLAKELGVLTAEAAAFQAFEGTKLTVRAMGITTHPVDHYVAELRKLFTMKSLAHGMANLAAIRGVGYGSGRVMQGAIDVRVKLIRSDVRKMIGVLKNVRYARAKGRKTISRQAEAEVAARLFHKVATLSALSGGKPGSFVKSAFALARDAAVRARDAGVGDVARSLGLRDGTAFEAAVTALPEAQGDVIARRLVELDALLKLDGKVPGLVTRVKMFLMRGMLKRIGFGLDGRGRLVPHEVAVRGRRLAGQRGFVDPSLITGSGGGRRAVSEGSAASADTIRHLEGLNWRQVYKEAWGYGVPILKNGNIAIYRAPTVSERAPMTRAEQQMFKTLIRVLEKKFSKKHKLLARVKMLRLIYHASSRKTRAKIRKVVGELVISVKSAKSGRPVRKEARSRLNKAIANYGQSVAKIDVKLDVRVGDPTPRVSLEGEYKHYTSKENFEAIMKMKTPALEARSFSDDGRPSRVWVTDRSLSNGEVAEKIYQNGKVRGSVDNGKGEYVIIFRMKPGSKAKFEPGKNPIEFSTTDNLVFDRDIEIIYAGQNPRTPMMGEAAN